MTGSIFFNAILLMDVFLNGDLTLSTSKIFLNVMRIKHLIILFPDYTGG